jgi:hypothetical protein
MSSTRQTCCVSMGWMRFNSSTNSSSRREVAMFTAEYEQFINQPCVSPQVFYGSRRSDAQRVGVRSLPDNGANLGVSIRGSTRIG